MSQLIIIRYLTTVSRFGMLQSAASVSPFSVLKLIIYALKLKVKSAFYAFNRVWCWQVDEATCLRLSCMNEPKKENMANPNPILLVLAKYQLEFGRLQPESNYKL